jgi:hypothetical protein
VLLFSECCIRVLLLWRSRQRAPHILTGKQGLTGEHGDRLLGDLRRAHPGHGRSVDLAFLVQPAEEPLKGPVARRGRRWRGPLQLGRDERLDASRWMPRAAVDMPWRARNAAKSAPSSVQARMVRGRLAASRWRRQNGGSALSSPTLAARAVVLAGVLDSTLCYRQARPARVTGSIKPKVR